MDTHILHIRNNPSRPSFNLIQNGVKRVEVRLNSLYFQNFKAGDIIIFCYNTKKCYTRIKRIRKYKTIYDCLVNENIDEVLPTISSITEGCKIYNEHIYNLKKILNVSNCFDYTFIAFQLILLD